MQVRYSVTLFLITLVMVCTPAAPALAEQSEAELASLVNEWRVELGVNPLERDERLYVAVREVAGDGTICPEDRMPLEFAIGGALYRSGYHDRRGYTLSLCGEYPTSQAVINWIRERGGPYHPDLEDVGVVHLAGLDFRRHDGDHVSDIWVLLAADPVDGE